MNKIFKGIYNAIDKYVIVPISRIVFNVHILSFYYPN